MEPRKLIRLGNSSFAIALPKDWVDKSGLKKGDDVFIERNGTGEIMISPSLHEKGNNKEVSINLLGKDEEEIARELISAYVSGYKIISVTGDKSKLRIAKEKSKNFLNLELLEEDDKKVLFKDLLNLEDINLEKFIRRMHNNIEEMFDILLNSIKTKKMSKENSTELDIIDKDITKFYFLIWRFMNLGIDNPGIQVTLKINSSELVSHFWISYNVEQIGDELKRISRKLSSQKNMDYFAQVITQLRDNYSRSMKAFFDKNKELSKEIILKKHAVIKMCEKLSEIRGFEAISEKILQINASIHSNSKMIYYHLK